MIKQPPEPPKPPEVENHAQNVLEDFGGSTSSGDIEPPEDNQPPVPEVQTHARNPSTGGSGDNGGSFHGEGRND